MDDQTSARNRDNAGRVACSHGDPVHFDDLGKFEQALLCECGSCGQLLTSTGRTWFTEPEVLDLAQFTAELLP